MGELFSIVYKPQDATPTGAAYTRIPISQAQLLAGHGIEGDLKGGSGSRHVNIMTLETMQELGGEGFLVEPGLMGEQLILSGIDVNALPAGTQLRIGSEACVELTEPRTGCAKFERYQEKPPQEAAGRLGMMARVVTSGAISLGDSVQVLSSETK